jgi:hypothetical protein
MCKLIVSTRLPALVCVAFAAFVLSAVGDDKPQPKPAKVALNAVVFVGGDPLIMKVLDEPTDMDFVETPLKDVVQAISVRRDNIPIQLDDKSITDAGGSADTPITFQLRGVSLKSALRLMLHAHDLDFVLSHDVLVITSAEKPRTLRKFEVADLLSNGTSIEELGEAVRFALPRVTEDPAMPGGGAGPASVDPSGRIALARDPSAPTRGIGRPVPIVGRGPVRSQPVGSTGSAADGEVVPFQTALLVRASDRGHANVETFLAELRHDMSKHDAAGKASADK